jgi:hypothetical protein
MDAKKAAQIKQCIRLNLQQMNVMKGLKKQILKLNDVLGEEKLFNISSEWDNEGICWTNFELYIPNVYQHLFSNEKLKEVFLPNKIKLIDIEEEKTSFSVHASKKLVIKGYGVLDGASLEKFITEIKAFQQLQLVQKNLSPDPNYGQCMPVIDPENAHYYHKKYEEFKATTLEESTTTSVPLTVLPKPAVIIHWESASYYSIDPVEPKVFPFEALSEKHFIASLLTIEDFGNVGLDKNCHMRFQAKIGRAKLAKGENDEGVILLPKNNPLWVRDRTGTFFCPRAKIKVLGEFGDARAFGRKEKSKNGEVLYSICSIDPHAH